MSVSAGYYQRKSARIYSFIVSRLVTTVGQDLDVETSSRLAKGPQTGINDLSVYFKEMGKLTEQKKISSRVRFLMQVSFYLINFLWHFLDHLSI